MELQPLAHLALLQASLKQPLEGRVGEALRRNSHMACLGVLLVRCPVLDPEPMGKSWAEAFSDQDFFVLVNHLMRHEDPDHFILGPLMRLCLGFGMLHGELVSLEMSKEAPREEQELQLAPFSLWQQASSVEAVVQRINGLMEPKTALGLEDVHRWLSSLVNDESGLPESISVPVVEGLRLDTIVDLLEAAFESGDVDEAGAERFTTAVLGNPPPPPA